MPPSSHFLKNNAEMIDAARHWVAQRQHLPALVLMYTHIDTLAWAGSTKQRQSTRKNFEAWVAQWLLPELAPHAPTLTATDLYAARCGVLHSLTSKSDLTRTGAAKEVAYAWGEAQSAVLDAAFAGTQFAGKIVTLHYQTLLSGLCEAVVKYMESAQSDPNLMASLEQAAAHHYMTIPVNKRPDAK